MKVEQLSQAEWIAALETLPGYPFFATPRYLGAWARHHVPTAHLRAWRIAAPDGAWRLAATVQVPTSRFGTVACIGAPDGGYGIAGQGPMPADWLVRLLTDMRGARTDRIELVIGPDEPLAPKLPAGIDAGREDAWVVDLSGGAQHWLERRIDKRVRRQLRISESEGLTTTRHGLDGLDEFHALYSRSLPEGPVQRLSYGRAFLSDLFTGDGPGVATIYLTRHGGQVVAGGLLLRGGRQALAWIGCFDRSAATLQPNLHRHWTALRELCDAGCAAYNLGAAPGLPDVARFKQKLGAEPRPYLCVAWRNTMLNRLRTWLGRGA